MFQDPRLYFLFIDYAFFSSFKTMLANAIDHFGINGKLEASSSGFVFPGSEPAFVNGYGVQESIPRNRFSQPM